MNEKTITLGLARVRVKEEPGVWVQLCCQEESGQCPDLTVGRRWDATLGGFRFLCGAHLAAWDKRRN